MDSIPAIRVAVLRVVRGTKTVLPGVTLDVARGKVVGLLGPSGCGKTTLMRAIVGVQIVAGGTVEVLGEPAGSPSLRSRVGYVTQAPAVYRDLTVRENLDYFRALVDAPADAIERVLMTVGLDAYAARVVDSLSGGERARVSLATALLHEPEVLVLDEPTVGLDPVLRRSLWGTFHALADAGTTLLVSSHVMDEAERCDSLVLMRDGGILAAGTPAEMLARTGAVDIETAFLTLVERPSSDRLRISGDSK